MQKFNFVKNLSEVLEDDEVFNTMYMQRSDIEKLKGLIKDCEYLHEYNLKIKSGITGGDFLKLTEQYFNNQI